MERFDFDKLKIASSSLGERLKTSGAQMSRIVSSKMKEILQAPTPESKMVDEATLETMEEPNWGLNLRICSMINSEELNGTEIVKTIKKKLLGKSPASQRLGLDLLEACTSNCEKVFSEVASEKVLDDMTKAVDDPKTDHENRVKAMQLIRAWGESEDLMYLPVFRQTYLNLKTRTHQGVHDEDMARMQNPLETYIGQDSISPPERYPVPDTNFRNADYDNFISYNTQSVEEKRETLVVTRNSLDILSSILSSEDGEEAIKNELTVSLLDKCKQSLPAVQGIAESTTDDEGLLFEALNLHGELQQVLTKYEEMEAALSSGGKVQKDCSSGGLQPDKFDSKEGNLSMLVKGGTEPERVSSPEVAKIESSSEIPREP